MTYGLFLFIFLVMPILLLGWVMRRSLTARHVAWIAALMLVALIYTTPWDNYLVATRVWWYDPERVWGVRFGWVPLEEYLFFLLQPILAGLWVLALDRRLGHVTTLHPRRTRLRWIALTFGILIWIAALLTLILSVKPGMYLGLELVWALPPILLQLFVGADILWARRQSVILSLATATLYLVAADALAIGSGVWTIDPAQSLGIKLAGVLPLEELIFFLLTNTLLIFSIHLLLAWEQSPAVFRDAIPGLRRWLRSPSLDTFSGSEMLERK